MVHIEVQEEAHHVHETYDEKQGKSNEWPMCHPAAIGL